MIYIFTWFQRQQCNSQKIRPERVVSEQTNLCLFQNNVFLYPNNKIVWHLCIALNPRYARGVSQTTCPRFTHLRCDVGFFISLEKANKPGALTCWYRTQLHWHHPQCSGPLCPPEYRIAYSYTYENIHTLFINLKAISPVPPATSSSFVVGPGSICVVKSNRAFVRSHNKVRISYNGKQVLYLWDKVIFPHPMNSSRHGIVHKVIRICHCMKYPKHLHI